MPLTTEMLLSHSSPISAISLEILTSVASPKKRKRNLQAVSRYLAIQVLQRLYQQEELSSSRKIATLMIRLLRDSYQRLVLSVSKTQSSSLVQTISRSLKFLIQKILLQKESFLDKSEILTSVKNRKLKLGLITSSKR